MHVHIHTVHIAHTHSTYCNACYYIGYIYIAVRVNVLLFVASGCYDGQLYVFSTKDGAPHWTLNTSHSEEGNPLPFNTSHSEEGNPLPFNTSHCEEGNPLPIKSSPCVDPVSGHLWFGSHNQHMHAIDIQVPR